MLSDPVNLIDLSGHNGIRSASPFLDDGGIGINADIDGEVVGDSTSSSPGGPFTDDQSALVDLGKQAEQRNQISQDDAETLLEWANEYNLPGENRIDEGHKGTKNDFPHLHLGPKHHIPICRGK